MTNVTPFRRPPRRAPAPQQQGGWGFKTHRGKAVLAQGLTLAAFVLIFPLLSFVFAFLPRGILQLVSIGVGVAAALIAFSNRDAGMPWANTHHEHALRTLILGFAFWTLASLLSFFGPLALATPILLFVIALWGIVRAGIGVVLAAMRKAIPNSRGWLI